MPKMKSNRGAGKRFRSTGAGGIKRAKAGKSHILTSKDRKRKRALRKSALVHSTNEKSIRRLLPYL
ncbi:MAG: 50S ribosomal protein L35 [Deltaproteobacteria bacterium CG2_30_66_27]|nr:MAG: 50S ribosomal protein L35 [Deltaproteobacteria bacterium CG2_30_66_27]PJB31253.1 MAG: 50S ribosomal protein L35 [Deltaproteobacteria bacterium CG_4_9_14_3_um_filter_65_9]